MDSNSSIKLYSEHGIDSRQFLQHYFSDEPEMGFAEDFLIFSIENLLKTFSEGRIKGDLLIDLSIGAIVHHLYAACEFFKDIIVLKVSDPCIMELKRWVDTHTGAFDWGHAAKLHAEFEGNSDQTQDREEKIRSAIQHVVKCDLQKENIIDPMVLPPADCIISVAILEVSSKDTDDYMRYLKKFSRMLKPGGHIMLLGGLGQTYFTVGNEKIHSFTSDEDFIKKALMEQGFVIDDCKVKQRTAVNDLIDYKAVIFIVAHKEM